MMLDELKEMLREVSVLIDHDCHDKAMDDCLNYEELVKHCYALLALLDECNLYVKHYKPRDAVMSQRKHELLNRLESSEPLEKVWLKDNTHCHAGKDGDCNWEHCPQFRFGERVNSARHCPLDTEHDEEG